MKKFLALFTALGLPACSASFQSNETQTQKILDSKFNMSMPQWVLDSAESKLIEDNGKKYFVSEIVRGPQSDNTAQLERVAALEASAQLAAMAAQEINAVVQASSGGENLRNATSSMNTVSETSVRISSLIPVASYWQLVEKATGKREYHAFAKVRIDSQELINAMAKAFVAANPDVPAKESKAVITESANNMKLGNVKPNEKIF